MKPKFVVFAGNNNLTIPLFEKNITEFFDLVSYDPFVIYDKSSTIFSLNQYQYYENINAVKSLISEGYKFIFENLHEATIILPEFLKYSNILFMFSAKRSDITGKNIVQAPLYFWYCESKSWGGKILDYRSLSRKNLFDKKFLLMMNYAKSFRTQIYTKFLDILDQSLYSFVDKGIRLDGDIDKNSMYWDRYINIDRYNKTQFSVVVETNMSMNVDGIFITEKSMKPFALKHPFISLSCANTVKMLKQNGFESFDNLFDESYDSEKLHTDRINEVYNQVKSFSLFDIDYDSLTKQKIEHNYNWFYNNQEVDRRFKLDIINPILTFLNE